MFEAQVDDCLLRRDTSRLVSLIRQEGLTATTLIRLDQLITKELCRCAFSRVLVLLKSLGILSESKDDRQKLISHGLTTKVTMWIEAVHNLLISDRQRSSTHLLSLTEEFFDYFLPIRSRNLIGLCKVLWCDSSQGSSWLDVPKIPPQLLAQGPLPISQLSVVLLQLAQFVLEEQVHFPLRLEAIRTFNSILESLSRGQRRLIQNDQNQAELLPRVAAAVLTVGDYELQVSLSEALCRLTPRSDRQQQASQWFSSHDLSNTFCDIKDADFEVDCRCFLNLVNSSHGGQRRVYTFPCLRAFLNSTQLFRPNDEKLDEFWIDFNVGSGCLSFFIDDPEGFLWGSIHLLKEEVEHYSISDKNGETVLNVRLSNPITHHNCRGRTVELSFNRELHGELEEAAGRVFKKAPSSPLSTEGSGLIQSSTPADKHTVRSYGRKKASSKSKLKILPLSSQSSDDDSSVSRVTTKSRAEILFDQIRTSTPMSTSSAAFELPSDLTDDLGVQETHLSSSTPPVSKVPHWACPQYAQEQTVEVQGGSFSASQTDMKRKREASDSGYLSNQTEEQLTQKRKAELHEEEAELHEEEAELHEEEAELHEEEAEYEPKGCSPTGVDPIPTKGLPNDRVCPVDLQAMPEQQVEADSHLTSDITAAFRTFREQMEEHFTDCWQKVKAEVLLSLQECQQHVSSLLTAVHQHRLLLWQRFETRVTDQLKQFEEDCTHVNSLNTQILSFFQSEMQRLGSFCEEHLQKLKSLESDKLESGTSILPMKNK